MRKMQIALRQFCPEPGKLEINEGIISETIREEAGKGTELLCFSECSLTGYTVEDAAEWAIGRSHEAVGKICTLAAEKEMIVSFGLMERDRDRFFLSQMIAGPAGTVCYRKTHLGKKEAGIFTAGDAFPVYRSGKNDSSNKEEEFCIGVCLCWESHIPEIAGVYRRAGVQILLVPYASGMHGEKCLENWSIHLPARASDNGIYVAAVNGLYRPDAPCGGGIAVYDPKGHRIEGYFGKEDQTVRVCVGGLLPREREEDMHHISYFDHRRPELY